MSTFETRRLRLCGLAALALLALAALPGRAGAAPAAPRWHVAFRSFPTVLAPGSTAEHSGTSGIPQYSAVITNVGAGVASGRTTVAVTLPSGVTLASGFEGSIAVGGTAAGFCHSPASRHGRCARPDRSRT